MKFIKEELQPIKKDLQVLNAEVKIIKKDNIKIRKDVSMIAGFFDQEYLGLRKRVESIEDHLNLPPIQ